MIDYWFPTGIYRSHYDKNPIVKSVLENYIQGLKKEPEPVSADWWPFWSSMQKKFNDPFTLPDTEINDLKCWIEQHINEFSKSFNSSDLYQIDQSWINVYHKGDFQETHYHPGSDFSAVYYVSVPTDSGKIIFENPLLPLNQRPIRTSRETELNSTAVIYEPVEGSLIIFRSNLRHGVLPHRSDVPRISIAVNSISKKTEVGSCS